MPRLLAIPLLLSCSLLSAKSYVADRYDVRVRVLSDASLDVTETVRFTFSGGDFTYVSREIPKRGLDRILAVAASMDGAPADAAIEDTGRRLRVRWRFQAEAESSHVFTLSYRVEGAIREDSGRALLHWRAIPEDREYRILAGEIAIEYPERDLTAPPDVPSAAAVRREPSRAIFTLDSVPPRRSVALRAAFRPEFLPRPPAWQTAARDAGDRARPAWIAAIAATSLTTLLAILWMLQTRAAAPPNVPTPPAPRDPEAAAAVFPPAFATRLSSGGSNAHAAMATLFDLARRGLLTIREDEPGRFGGRSYRIEAADLSLPREPFEDVVLRLALPGGDESRSAGFAKFASRLTTGAGPFNEALGLHMTSLGLIDPERRAARQSWFTRAVLALFLSLGAAVTAGLLAAEAVRLGFALGALLLATLAGAGAGGFLAAIAALFFASSISPLAPPGAAAASAFRALRQTLSRKARGDIPVAPQDFERWLPVTIAVGLGPAWVKRFRREAASPLPDWFFAGDDGQVALYNFVSHSAVSADASSSAGGGDGGSGGGSSSAG